LLYTAYREIQRLEFGCPVWVRPAGLSRCRVLSVQLLPRSQPGNCGGQRHGGISLAKQDLLQGLWTVCATHQQSHQESIPKTISGAEAARGLRTGSKAG